MLQQPEFYTIKAEPVTIRIILRELPAFAEDEISRLDSYTQYRLTSLVENSFKVVKQIVVNCFDPQ